MIRAVFFDIDGTLIPMTTGRMPQSTIDALYALKEKGVKLFIASGRPPAHLTLLCEEFNAFPWDGFLMMNGQYCYDRNHEVYRAEKIAQETLRQLVPWLKKEADFPCTFFELDHSYDIAENEAMKSYLGRIGRMDQMPLPEDPQRSYTHDTYQISPYVPRERDEEILAHAPGLISQRWSPYFTDMIASGGGKPEGIRETLKRYGIKREECMAFGDGGNDITMLEFAAVGVAMGNASQEVQSHADYVTADCEDDGICKAFKHFGLI